MAGQAFVRGFGDKGTTLSRGAPGQSLTWPKPTMKSEEVAPGVVIKFPVGEVTPIVNGEPGKPTVTKTDDGGSVVDLNPQPKVEPGSEKGGWKANLALKINDFDLGLIAEELLQGIDADLRSRTEWEQAYIRGLDLLGIKLQEPSSTPTQGQLTGVSSINNPALLEACLRFQAGAIGEMLPADGPAKIEIDGEETELNKMLADDFEQDFNHYLTTVDKDFYPDTTRGLFHVGFYGGIAKKPYWDPLLRRPVSRCVYLWDLIISQDAITINTAARVTHRSKMRSPTVKRLMKQGVWKTQILTPPTTGSGSTPGDKEKQLVGIQNVTERQQDREHVIYECYCDLDLVGYEHTEGGEETGITLPYVVTIDKDSKRVLALRRNWKEDDDNYTPRRPFVLFPFVLGLGFYPIGLLHIMGNTTRALTAIDREMVDCGMYANFPGGLISDMVSRQETNEMQVGPGGFKQIKTGGLPIGDVLMAFPYKDVTPGLMALREKLMDEAQRLGGSALIPVGEGQPDIPVGTMLALIEQATKPEAAVHKLLHRAQAEELQLLRDLFVEDPDSLSRWTKDPARQWRMGLEFADLNLIPVSDPNVPSHTHRIMQVTALVQLYQLFQAQMQPDEVLKRALAVIGMKDTEALLAPPGSQPPGGPGGLADLLKGKQPSPAQDAAALLKAQAAQKQVEILGAKAAGEQQDSQRKAATEAVHTQMEMQKLHLDMENQQADLADRAADRQTKLQIAQFGEDTERIRLQIEESRAQREQMQLAEEQHQSRQVDLAKHLTDADLADRHHGIETKQADRHHRVDTAVARQQAKAAAKRAAAPKPAAKSKGRTFGD